MLSDKDIAILRNVMRRRKTMGIWREVSAHNGSSDPNAIAVKVAFEAKAAFEAKVRRRARFNPSHLNKVQWAEQVVDDLTKQLEKRGVKPPLSKRKLRHES